MNPFDRTMTPRAPLPVIFAAAMLSILWAGPGDAQGESYISNTDAQFLMRIHKGADSPQLGGKLVHFSTWKYGSNFSSVDVSAGPNLEPFTDHVGLFLKYRTVFNLHKLGVITLSEESVLKDFGIAGEMNTGWTPTGFAIARVFMEGAHFSWAVPGFDSFNTILLARQEVGYDPTWQAAWIVDRPFAIRGVQGTIKGFANLWRRQGGEMEDHTAMMAQPQILFTFGSPEPHESMVQIGIELEPSYNFPNISVERGWNLEMSPKVRWQF